MKVRVRVDPPKAVTVSVVVLVRHADNVRIGPKTITENGTYYPANESLDGYSPVVVDVKAQPKLQDKTVDPAIVPVKVKADPPNDGLGEVTVNAMPGVEQVTPQITVDEESGVVTAKASQPSGYVVGGTKENSKQLKTKGAQIYTPGDEEKIIPAGVFLTGKQTLAKVPTQETTITENGEHIPPSGRYYSKVVVAVPESGGTDTDDANATPSDMAAGTSGYVKGEKVEGILPVKAAGTTETIDGEGLAIEGGKLKMTTTAPADAIHRAGSKTEVETNADALGIATPSMVLEDATFTSKDGIGQEGTIPRNGDTSATFDGIEVKSVEIPAGYTTGGTVALDSTIDGHVDDQAALIAEIAEALEGKAAGGGGGGSTTIAVENVINLHTAVEVESAVIPNLISPDMRTWSKNAPAEGAYTSIIYDETAKLNTCQYTGVGMFEFIGYPVALEAGKRYTFSIEYYTPNTLTGDYAEPYAPYIGFFPESVLATDANSYSSNYAVTNLALSVSGYTTYSVTYTPSSAVSGCVAFGMGSTRDGISVELNIRNAKLLQL